MKKSKIICIFIIVVLVIIAGVMGYKIVNKNNEKNISIEKEQDNVSGQIESNTIEDENTQLTKEELEEITKYINEEENNGFILSEYKEGKEINYIIALVCATQKIGESGEEVVNDYERITGDGCETALYRYKMQNIDNFFQEKLGTKVDIKNEYGGIYDENSEYFYVFPGGAYFDFVEITEGYKQGEIYNVKGKFLNGPQYSDNEDGTQNEYNGFKVTLKKYNNGYVFVNNEYVNI